VHAHLCEVIVQASEVSDSPSESYWKYASDLGVALSRARATRGYSQEQLAAAAGITAFTYRKIEKGVSNPGSPSNPQLHTLLAIAEVLGVPLVSLLPHDPGDIAPGR
jgi:transcriptional regulator with XRE-family HTH domain